MTLLRLNPRMEVLPEKKLVGQRLTMSFSTNKTHELWRNFMIRRNDVRNGIGSNRFSIQMYPPQFFEDFHMDTEFCKWAAVEVSDFEVIPAGMERLTLPGGLYAVFVYRGTSKTAVETFQYIFGTWLPASDFVLDTRPHFELLGENYRYDHPKSEEEIWIPVRPQKIEPNKQHPSEDFKIEHKQP